RSRLGQRDQEDGDRRRNAHAPARRTGKAEARADHRRGALEGNRRRQFVVGARTKTRRVTVVTLRQLLEEMTQKGASDLHITAGVPPEFRVDGLITPSEHDVLSPDLTAQLAYSVMSDEQRKRFETTRELDFSFGVKGLSRFR